MGHTGRGEGLPKAYLPWMEMALCRGISDPEIFYSRYDDDIAEAKRLCAACPTYWQCRTHSLATREPFGVWAGLTEKERKQVILGFDMHGQVIDPPVHPPSRAPKG